MPVSPTAPAKAAFTPSIRKPALMVARPIIQLIPREDRPRFELVIGIDRRVRQERARGDPVDELEQDIAAPDAVVCHPAQDSYVPALKSWGTCAKLSAK